MKTTLPSQAMKGFLALICAVGLSQAIAVEQAGVTEDNIVGAIDPVVERRLGELILADVLRYCVPSTDQAQIGLVNKIGYRILHAIDDSALIDDWQFIVINTEKTNAFSLPGGKIIISTGLLGDITADGKIDVGMFAAILGHEIAHVRMHHTLAALRNSASMTWIIDNLSRLDSETTTRWTEEQKSRTGEMARARFTREQEFEADQMGSLYAALADYGFDGLVRWAQLELKTNGDTSQTEYLPARRVDGEVLAEDHPAFSERIAKVRSFQARLLNIAGEFTWGNEMLRVGNLNKAIECFKDVVAVFPNCFEAWNNLGKAYHLRYLQGRKVADLKFQAQLVDYSRDVRDIVRGSSGLHSAIQAYRRAKELDPAKTGVRLNLATALLHDAQTNRAGRGDDLSEAGLLLNALLAKQPDNPQFLNAKAILLHENKAAGEGGRRNEADVEDLFRKAATRSYLPAQFNLAVAQIENGHVDDGIAGLKQYLQYDSSSRWAALARATLQAKHAETPPSATTSTLQPLTSVLGVKLGATSAQLVEVLKKPERVVQDTTTDGSAGEIYLYYSLGAAFVISEGRVESINLFSQGQPQSPPAIEETPPAPELAGIPIGSRVEALEKAFGKATQIRQAQDSTEKIYSYLSDTVQIDFFVQLSKIYLITLRKRA